MFVTRNNTLIVAQDYVSNYNKAKAFPAYSQSDDRHFPFLKTESNGEIKIRVW